MTVKELIEILKTFEKETTVNYFDSDEGWQEIERVRRITINGKPIIEISDTDHAGEIEDNYIFEV